MLTQEDAETLSNKGLTEDSIQSQIETFKKGFPFAKLTAPALINDGIFQVQNHSVLIEKYDKSNVSAVKFIPASGAASRMFKTLFEFLSSDQGLFEDMPVFRFFKELERFAFYTGLKNKFYELYGYTIEEAHLKKEYRKILKTLLNENGLNYGNLPKGLLDFHEYEEEIRKPAKEHLVEGIEYAQKAGKVNLHFTVSPEHKNLFQDYLDTCIPSLNNIDVQCDYSIQDPATDTIAVTLENEPYRNQGKLFFRPAGHGALLQNLDTLKEEIIFIKNIDNVVPDRLKEETIKYKKILAGLLLHYREKVFDLLRRNDDGEDISEEGEELLSHLGLKGDLSKAEVIRMLNRPIRVCGMVKNQGEPGGGPFWVKNNKGYETLQIVESVQVDHQDSEQENIFKSSSHFNPVDLVCSTYDYRGNKFDLMQFRDMQTGIITEKTVGADKVKAMELPGLWNGSMADWNTVFVEVPLITFNPVKTVMDLLRPEHQPQ